MGTPNARDQADKAAISMPMAANFECIFVYLLARAFLAPGMPVTVALISVLASGRDIGHIRRLQYSKPPEAAQRPRLKRPNLYLAPNNVIQVVSALTL